MVELWKSLSDDQMALVGCAVALLVAGTIMSLSYYVGRARTALTSRKLAANLKLPSARNGAAQRRDAA
jgi:hypothetical protein